MRLQRRVENLLFDQFVDIQLRSERVEQAAPSLDGALGRFLSLFEQGPRSAGDRPRGGRADRSRLDQGIDPTTAATAPATAPRTLLAPRVTSRTVSGGLVCFVWRLLLRRSLRGPWSPRATGGLAFDLLLRVPFRRPFSWPPRRFWGLPGFLAAFASSQSRRPFSFRHGPPLSHSIRSVLHSSWQESRPRDAVRSVVQPGVNKCTSHLPLLSPLSLSLSLSISLLFV